MIFFYNPAKFKFWFRQAQQVQGLTKKYEDRSWPFDDTYNLVVSTQYLILKNIRFSVYREKNIF